MAHNIPGGLGENTIVTPEVLGFCAQVRNDVENAALPVVFQVYEPLWFRAQVVDGGNYFVKILVGPGAACVHVEIFQPLGGGDVEFRGIQTGKTVRDVIEG